MRRIVALVCAAANLACDPGSSDVDPSVESSAAPAQAEAAQEAPDDARARPGASGRFREARRLGSSLTPEQQRIADELNAIGYVSGSQPARASGVTRHDPEATQAGLNFFTSGHTEGAVLMDLDGNVLHEWHLPFPDVSRDGMRPRRNSNHWWRRAYLFPNGDVLAVITGSGLLKIDVNSNLLWATPIHAHHDLAFAPNGDIYALTRSVRIMPRVNPDEPIVDDRVVVLDSDGNEKRSISLLEALADSEFAEIWTRTGRRSGDVFHTNSIEYLDGSIADVDPAFRAGNLLVSMLRLNAIAVVDPRAERVVWAHTGSYRSQHDPKILPNGNLLLFDNHGDEGPSAVLEFDPRTMDVVWEFRGTEEEPFYSKTCGTAERLANGNTLISETDFGRAFEVTQDGRVVWEFYNPHRAGEHDRFIASLPEMIRLPADFPVGWLDGRPTPGRSDGG